MTTTHQSKVHQCEYCDKNYARLNNLIRHEQAAHHAEVVRRMRAAGLFDYFRHTCRCMTEPDAHGVEYVATHSSDCPDYLA